ncbi:hypothetical protein P4O66_000532 [Electrophorus voltai]|uniref:VWFD domain-containing protein n=1 Tax=Electrophorus voltai TaxID=2609070 RepID=A0AAD9E0M2_9TELE|nr:hypothetical protein P4O66_000532 [Electrophorus voltai]
MRITVLLFAPTADGQVNIIPPVSKISMIAGVKPAHNERVCSTWGNYHFKTFDGDIFQLPSTCNYILTSQCGATYEDFNIQMRRQVVNDQPTISRITMKLDGTTLEITKSSIIVDGHEVNLPFGHFGVFIEKNPSYIKVTAKLGLVALWNGDDALMVELDNKYKNQTCGLCGDFNGVQLYNEFIKNAKTCPQQNMVHQECGNPCIDTCSNPDRDYVFDDLTGKGCIDKTQCSCTHKGKIYHPGQTFTGNCKEWWTCKETDCPGICSVEGGSHIITFDGKTYNFHGDCTYIFTKQTNGTEFTVVGDLVKCGLTDTETCLKGITLALSSGITVFNILPDGKVFVNRIFSQLPISTGLCGNFNNIQSDDFTTMSGSREGTGVGFANSWRTRANCREVKNTFENPCSLSLENEKYAQHWCSLLSDPNGVFAPCHSEISPDIYQKNCMYDTCNCEKSESCMCAALSAYAHACASKGIILNGWRNAACRKYANCPSTMVYSYDVQNSTQSCRCHNDPDFTCAITFEPVDGCICTQGTYLDEEGKCVPTAKCSCYYKGSVIPPGEVITKDGTMW